MTKEYVEGKIVNNISAFLEEFVDYFGEEYREEIFKRARNIRVCIARENSVFDLGFEKRYVEDEPVCVKDGGMSYIILTLKCLADKRGNVFFVHVLLHSLGEDCFEDKNVNEVMIDYMANDISVNIGEKGLNISLNEDPCYESSSLYSGFFDDFEKFYVSNKGDIFKKLWKGEKVLIDGDFEKELASKISGAMFGEIKERNIKKCK